MTAKRCWECNNTFYSDFGGLYCNVCNQAIKTRQANERQASQAQWAAEQAQREAASIQAQHTQALINAENARIAAINHQTKVIAESIIKPKEAYDRGYNYVDNEFRHGNPAELKIEVYEDGSINGKWQYLYITDRLNTEFKKGLGARLNQYSNIYDTLKASAKATGKGNADGSFSSTHFTLHTGLTIGGVVIKTKGFRSHFTSTIDEETGELKMNWKEPFKDPVLNQAYKDGVNEVYWAENTDEKKNYRLRFEVPELIAAREHTKGIRRLDKLFRFSVYTAPILFFWLMWQLTSGWATFFMLIIAFMMPSMIRKQHYKWWNNNSEHLR